MDEDWHAKARAWLQSVSPVWLQTDVRNALCADKLRRALDEIAEYRARLGLEAPEGWERSDEALWERLVGPVDADGEPRDGALLVHLWTEGPRWEWWTPGACKAEGEASTVLEAMRAAEEAAGLRESGTK